MPSSLSAILPIRNAPSLLAAAVTELLEVLTELTRPAELIVVDDGSTDATIEVAYELPPRFPQVRVVRHSRSRGRAEALRTGLSEACGEVVFFQDAGCTLAIDELPKLWRAAARHEIVIGRADPSADPRRADAEAGASGNYQFARRAALRRIAAAFCDEQSLRQVLTRLGLPWHEMAVRARRRRHDLFQASAPAPVPAVPTRADQPEKPAGRPNYLARLRAFALGE